MREVRRIANACHDRSIACSEKTRKRAWIIGTAVLPQRKRRGYYRDATGRCKLFTERESRTHRRATPQPPISPGIHAGVHVPFNRPSSPVYGTSRWYQFPLATH